MRILIIGASGLIGSNAKQHFLEKGHLVLGTYFSYQSTNDIYLNTLNENLLQNSEIEAFNPEWIIHTGALTHVDKCELEPKLSHQQTVISTENIIKLADKYSCKILYISTDYVFDGTNGPYFENDSVNPINVYGQHKLESENLVKIYSNNLIIRVTNVYGNEERNKNFVARLVQNINSSQHAELKLPIDQYATPVNALDVAKAMELLISHRKAGIYNIASTDYMNRVQLANVVLQHYNYLDIKVISTDTKSLKQAAKRPLNGGLKSHKFLQEFPDFTFHSVKDYLLSMQSK